MTFVRGFVCALLALAAVIGLLALSVRVAGGPDAWKVGLMIVATGPALAFAARERR